jgi:hypothetical protein
MHVIHQEVGYALTLPVPLTHTSPDGQHLRGRVAMLQSSPQHVRSKSVVALLKQRLEAQQPSLPQHTCTCHSAVTQQNVKVPSNE